MVERNQVIEYINKMPVYDVVKKRLIKFMDAALFAVWTDRKLTVDSPSRRQFMSYFLVVKHFFPSALYSKVAVDRYQIKFYVRVVCPPLGDGGKQLTRVTSD